MGVYYDFYLERKIEEDKWLPIKYKGKDYFYSVRSIGRAFVDEYCDCMPMSIEYMNEEFKEKNLEKYNNLVESEKIFFNRYYLMDLDRIAMDYKNKIHEYAGIISLNDYKKLQSNLEYSPKIVDESAYAKFKDNIKEHYIYHEWDTYYGEEYYLYELMPIIEEMLVANNLTLSEVRLLCEIS